ncbi:MAG TPA: RsmE family RNA methyltransferase [Lacipirellulaceae bacterium]|nr:RsmE family RNA methyltransferase [Lacipirellulaceae bacterium]
MNHRCYSAEPVSGDAIALAGVEAHHLLHVLRATPGMRVVLLDGSGDEFDAEVVACRRSSVELAIHGRRTVDREFRPPVTLGVALPKGDRQRWIVEKAVELGVARLVPLVTQRSAAGDRPGDKLSRYVIEASKQCGRNRLMEIADPCDWADWLATGVDGRRWVAAPTGSPLPAPASLPPQPLYVAIGPEGGFTADELQAARDAGWQVVALGPRILRIETAAAALAAWATLGATERSGA